MTKNKCKTCKKLLSLVESIKGLCRCNNIYCSEHIYIHICNFDYKEMERQKLIKSNPQIISEKIKKI
jgi:hypothetical protein